MRTYNLKSFTSQLSPYEVYSGLRELSNLDTRLKQLQIEAFLDSAKEEDSQSRFSIMGISPEIKVMVNEQCTSVNGETVEGDFFQVLNQIMASRHINNKTELPFIGGAIGFLSYDLGRQLEVLPELNKALYEMPDAYMVFYRLVMIYEHQDKLYHLVGTYDPQEPKEKHQIEQDMTYLLEQIDDLKPLKSIQWSIQEKTMVSSFEEAAYIQAVNQMRSYIEQGDMYIANMTHTFVGETNEQPDLIYRALREVNQAPFAAYLPYDEVKVLCSSPERFIQIKNQNVETRPIKGTRPRGATPEEDMLNRLELEASEKDKSELLMIVDLERNDLSKVCRPGSVKVTELFKTESYATVFHLVAAIEGKLQEGKTAVDCLAACFPGGSITGAPKIRAMEIIEELEHHRRGLYTGCIGYLGYEGNMDMNIVIRTIVLKGQKAYIGVGGGITWESEAAAEYQETLDKGKALFKALSYQLKE